jgi:endoglucanase
VKFKLIIIFLLLSTVAFIQAQPVRKYGQLKVVGTKLVDAKGNPVSLHGMSFGWHNFWPRFYSAGAVEWLSKDWNCTVMRAAMGVEPPKGYIQDSLGSLAAIKSVVDASIKANIYVIIDWHSHNIRLKEAKIFFAEMAKLYGKYPHVIYEIFNEPDKETWPEVKAYSEELISTIRAIDPDNIILIGSPAWDQSIHLPAADPIKGFDNLMYTVHFYAATHKQWLRDRTDDALRKGLPIFISESAGMEATGDGPINYAEWKEWINWMDEKGLSWIAWSVSDKNETCSVLNPTASSNGKWKNTDIKESGKLVREYLRSYSEKKKPVSAASK